MTKLLATLAILLIALSSAAYSQPLEAQKIRPGDRASTVVASLRTERTVVDTADTIASVPGDIVVRIAPVKLCGIDGYLALHTDRNGIITNFYWSRQPKEGYYPGGAWETFRLWDDWKPGTMKDLEAMKKNLEKEMGRMDSITIMPVHEGMVVTIRPVDIARMRADSTGVTLREPSRQTLFQWTRDGVDYHLLLAGPMLEFGTAVIPSRRH